jgi:predicted Zn-dependent protease
VHGALNLALTADIVTPQNFPPFDTDMTRQKGNVFSSGHKALSELNDLAPQGRDPEARSDFHMWDIVVRNWHLNCGKKLNRAFTNKSKIAKQLDMTSRSFSKLGDSPARLSARGVLMFAAGDVDDALEAQRATTEAAPNLQIHHMRISNLLFLNNKNKATLFQLRKASNLTGWYPCYQAELAQRL